MQLASQVACKHHATFVVVAIESYKWRRTLTDFYSLVCSPLFVNPLYKLEDV
jgi:translation initiation factor 2B subunit (eIF-2B alpha/beta/delta family)